MLKKKIKINRFKAKVINLFLKEINCLWKINLKETNSLWKIKYKHKIIKRYNTKNL
jgi:hypothetical protein